MTNATGIPYIYDTLSVRPLIAWELVLCAVERNTPLDTDWNSFVDPGIPASALNTLSSGMHVTLQHANTVTCRSSIFTGLF